jgi:hypothetical protein
LAGNIKITMKAISQILHNTSNRFLLVALLILAAVLHSGTTIKGGLYADDYIHAAFFQALSHRQPLFRL